MGKDIPYSTFQAMAGDLELMIRGDGRDSAGRLFGIYRYRSKSTGKIYDEVTANADHDEPRVTEYPKPE